MARRALKFAVLVASTLPLTLAGTALAMTVDVQLESGCAITRSTTGFPVHGCDAGGGWERSERNHLLGGSAVGLGNQRGAASLRRLLGTPGPVWRTPVGQSAVDLSKIFGPGFATPFIQPTPRPTPPVATPTTGPAPVAANPEPGSLATFALGALLVGSRLGRRRKA